MIQDRTRPAGIGSLVEITEAFCPGVAPIGARPSGSKSHERHAVCVERVHRDPQDKGHVLGYAALQELPIRAEIVAAVEAKYIAKAVKSSAGMLRKSTDPPAAIQRQFPVGCHGLGVGSACQTQSTAQCRKAEGSDECHGAVKFEKLGHGWTGDGSDELNEPHPLRHMNPTAASAASNQAGKCLYPCWKVQTWKTAW